MVVEQPIDQLFRPILTATDETYPEDKRPEGSRPECYQVQLTVPGVSLDDVAMMRGQSAQHISITATKKPAGFYGHSEAAKAVQNLEVSVLLPERFDTCLDRVDPFEFVDRSLADGLLTLAFPTSRSVSKLENRAIPLALPRGFPKELGHLAPAKLKELQASLVKLITEHKAKEAQAAPQQPPALADFQSENVIERLDWERALQRVVTQLNANAAPPAQPD